MQFVIHKTCLFTANSTKDGFTGFNPFRIPVIRDNVTAAHASNHRLYPCSRASVPSNEFKFPNNSA